MWLRTRSDRFTCSCTTLVRWPLPSLCLPSPHRSPGPTWCPLRSAAAPPWTRTARSPWDSAVPLTVSQISMRYGQSCVSFICSCLDVGSYFPWICRCFFVSFSQTMRWAQCYFLFMCSYVFSVINILHINKCLRKMKSLFFKQGKCSEIEPFSRISISECKCLNKLYLYLDSW